MITCPICSTDNDAGAQFCANCGATLAGYAGPVRHAPDEPPPVWSPPPAPHQPPPVWSPPAPPPAYAGPYPGAPAQRKSGGTALILEIVPALFGFFGIGWFYAGHTGAGLAWLIGMLAWEAFAVFLLVVSAGVACVCVVPINIGMIALSATLLNKYTRQHPERFGP